MACVENRKERRKKGTALAFLIIGLIAVAGISLIGISAKYVFQKSENKETASSQFYFTSDLLSEAGKTYTLNANTTELTIELYNKADDLRWADNNIAYSYTVSYTEDTSGNADAGQTGGTSAWSNGNGTLLHNASTSTTGTIQLTGLQSGTYTVTATATSPFTKTLTGKFVIPAQDTGVEYKVDDTNPSPYAVLTVWTKDYSGEVTVSWPERVFPDQTQEAFESRTDLTSDGETYSAGYVTVKMEKNSSYTWRFFKKDISEDYSGDSSNSSGTQIKAEKTN